MKLFFAPRTYAVRIRWTLEELGVPYELERVDPATLRTLLVDGPASFSVSAAACLYLADRYPERSLAPAPGAAARAEYLQWLLFAEGPLEQAIADQIDRTVRPEHPRPEPSRLVELLAEVQAHLSGRAFVAGDAFSAADVVLACVLHRANSAGLLKDHPSLHDYVYRLVQRPELIRAVRT